MTNEIKFDILFTAENPQRRRNLPQRISRLTQKAEEEIAVGNEAQEDVLLRRKKRSIHILYEANKAAKGVNFGKEN